jgi:4-hydroxy-tetrahydrodipicolinate synthase
MSANGATPRFTGSFVALLTPFRDGKVDEDAFRAFVEWHIEQGTQGLVPCGTTGESPTLSHAEHRRVTELCIEQAAGRVPVLAGAGSNSTAEAIGLAQHAQEAGADGALVVTPYYNKPTQEGMYQHYKAIAEAIDIPVLIYNIPGRSVVDMSVETMKRLAEDFGNIVGVKDATYDLARPTVTKLEIGEDFCQLSGEDATACAFLAQGGHGCISVTANVAPKLCSDMHIAWRQRDIETMLTIQDRLMPLHKALFCESSPGPVKYAAQLLGLCSEELRLPLAPIAEASRGKVEHALRHAGLLN